MSLLLRLALLLTLTLSMACGAAEVTTAVAANFSAPMKVLAEAFEKETGHRVVMAYGATGQLYAQIVRGAPFEVLLAADDETPKRLEAEGHTVPGSRFRYATGRLVLWSRIANRVDERGEILLSGRFERLAIANPQLAPYGAAARQTLKNLGIADSVSARVIEAGNATQAYQFVASGNADLGLLALSHVWADNALKSGSAWLVPAKLHDPLHQEAVLLKQGRNNPAAEALLAWLKTDKVRTWIRQYGYE